MTGVVTAAARHSSSQLYETLVAMIALGNQLSLFPLQLLAAVLLMTFWAATAASTTSSGNNALDLSSVGGIGTAATFAQFFAEGGMAMTPFI